MSAAELVPLAREKGLPLIEDLGSGTLVDLETWGLPHEPTAREAIEAGVDVVTFSGDKLLGGPQAGLIVGRKHLIERIARNPMKRALRLDKVRLAALEATLRLYADPDAAGRAAADDPRAGAPGGRDPRARPSACCRPSRKALGGGAEAGIEPVRGQIGSGALPVDLLPSFALAVARQGRSTGWPTPSAACRFPVIGRIGDGTLSSTCARLDDEAAFARPTGQARCRGWLGSLDRDAAGRAAPGRGARRRGTPATMAWRSISGRRSRRQGVARAQSNMGAAFLEGRGVERDPEKAAAWLRRAAEQGDAGGQRNLALCYYEGWGVPQDQVEAAALVREGRRAGRSPTPRTCCPG